MYGEKIKAYFDANDIKYTFLANETKIPLNTLSAMLNSKRKILIEKYFKICIGLMLALTILQK